MLTLDSFPSATYDIEDFGACASDKPQTAAIQKAIDQCFLQGGGRVVIPAGVFFDRRPAPAF